MPHGSNPGPRNRRLGPGLCLHRCGPRRGHLLGDQGGPFRRAGVLGERFGICRCFPCKSRSSEGFSGMWGRGFADFALFRGYQLGGWVSFVSEDAPSGQSVRPLKSDFLEGTVHLCLGGDGVCPRCRNERQRPRGSLLRTYQSPRRCCFLRRPGTGVTGLHEL